jgi:hypothetical protein
MFQGPHGLVRVALALDPAQRARFFKEEEKRCRRLEAIRFTARHMSLDDILFALNGDKVLEDRMGNQCFVLETLEPDSNPFLTQGARLSG